MRFLTIAGAFVFTFLLASVSQAAVSLVTRFDYSNVRTTKSNNLPTDIAGRSEFNLSLINLNATGKVAGGDVYLTLDPNGIGGLTINGSSGFVYNLYYQKAFYEDWWFKAGRLINVTGGFEAIAIDSGDDYWSSLANLNPKLDSTAPSGNRAGRLGNHDGLAIGFDGKLASLEIQVLNDVDSGNDPDTSPNTSHSIGAVFNRNFFENFWLKLHYFVYQVDDAVTDVDLTYRGIGLRWKTGRHDLTFDYLSNGYIDQAIGNDEDLTNSTIVNYHFAWTEQKIPFLKAEYSELIDKPSNTFDMKRTAITLGLEYWPKANEGLRYHIAAISVTDDYKTDRDVNQPRFIAGLKFDTDLLK